MPRSLLHFAHQEDKFDPSKVVGLQADGRFGLNGGKPEGRPQISTAGVISVAGPRGASVEINLRAVPLLVAQLRRGQYAYPVDFRFLSALRLRMIFFGKYFDIFE